MCPVSPAKDMLPGPSAKPAVPRGFRASLGNGAKCSALFRGLTHRSRSPTPASGLARPFYDRLLYSVFRWTTSVSHPFVEFPMRSLRVRLAARCAAQGIAATPVADAVLVANHSKRCAIWSLLNGLRCASVDIFLVHHPTEKIAVREFKNVNCRPMSGLIASKLR